MEVAILVLSFGTVVVDDTLGAVLGLDLRGDPAELFGLGGVALLECFLFLGGPDGWFLISGWGWFGIGWVEFVEGDGVGDEGVAGLIF